MGERDYLRDSGSGPRLAMPRMQPVTKTLMWINIGVWVVTFLVKPETGLARAVYESLMLSPRMWHEWFPYVPLWQLVTYGFLHSLGDVTHVLFNMLGLYFFGTWLEGIVGPRRLLFLYLTSIVFGGAVQLAGSLAANDMTPTVGASGAVMFLLIAMAVLQPEARVFFFIFPMKLRTLALIYIGLNVFQLVEQIRGSGSSVAVLVHLAGAAFGLAAVKLGWIWYDPLAALQARRERRQVEDLRTDGERLDQLLQQIHERGIGSLSKSEREFLKRMSSRNSG